MSHNDTIHWHQQFDCTIHTVHTNTIQYVNECVVCLYEQSVGSEKMPMCEC